MRKLHKINEATVLDNKQCRTVIHEKRNKQCEPYVHPVYAFGGTSQIAEKGGETQAEHGRREWDLARVSVWDLRVRVSGRRDLPGEKTPNLHEVPLSVVSKTDVKGQPP